MCICAFQASCPTCRETRLALSLPPLSPDLPCPPTPHLVAHCIPGWVPTPRAAPQALTDLKDHSMDTKVRACSLLLLATYSPTTLPTFFFVLG